MSRVVEEPVVIVPDSRGKPYRFMWRTNWSLVTNIIEEWRDTGCWWDNEGEKMFFRLQTSSDGVYEIYHDLKMQKWFMYRVFD